MKKTLLNVLRIAVVCALLCAMLPAAVSAYTNPFEFKEHPNHGDPYILKYNGVYFQYANGEDPSSNVKGIQLWTSRDLLNWEYRGICTDLPADHLEVGGMYAPEVRYLDGKFYISSAPGGQGHYFYVSDSPYGPFTVATENLGRKFDGTVMMDSDNTLWFVSPYKSGDGNLRLETLSDPLTFSSDRPLTLSTTVGGDRWTEGPTLFKRLGTYYMTYTGNHVWEASYRIEYAFASNPKGKWTELADNSILFETEGDLVGLGHNSIFIGPDLDTYYITYHNLTSPSSSKNVSRRANYNRIVWNGQKLIVQGPTSWDIDDPALPDFYEYFDNDAMPGFEADGTWTVADNLASASSGTLLTKTATGDVFTAEYNLKGDGSVLFGYKDAQNYGRVWIDESAKAFKAEIVANGSVTWSAESALHNFFDYEALHTVRVQQSADTLRILLNDVERILEEKSGLTGGKIGYRADGAMSASFTAYSHKAIGSADHELYAPLPGTIAGVHYANTDAALTMVEAAGDKVGYAIEMAANDTAAYNVHFKNDNSYSLTLSVADVAANTKVEILVDGQVAATVDLPTVGADAYRSLPLRQLRLPEGKRQLSVRVVSGSLELYEISVERDAEGTSVSTDCDSKYDSDGTVPWKVYESIPSWGNGTMNITATGTPKNGKALAGKVTDTDYIVEGDVKLTSTQGSAGFLFRIGSEGNGHNPDVSVNNPTYHQGYNLSVSKGMIALAKQNYGENKQLAVALDSSITSGKNYHVKIAAVGDTITVWVDGKEMLNFTDTDCPYLTGRAGVRVYNGSASFDNFSITPTDGLLAVTKATVSYGAPQSVKYSKISEKGSSDIPASDPNGGSTDSSDPSDPNGTDAPDAQGGDMTVILIAVAAVVVIAAAVVVVLLLKKKKTA